MYIYIYDVTNSIAVRPPVWPMNRKPATFPVQWAVQLWKHWFILSFVSFYFISWNDEYIGCWYWKVTYLIGFSYFLFIYLFCSFWMLDKMFLLLFNMLFSCFSSLIWFDFVLFSYFPLFVIHWLNHDIRFIWI